MELAALILSVIALLIGGASLVWQLAKQLSTHQVQLVPMQTELDAIAGPKADPIGDIYRDFDRPKVEPLSKDESAYFEKFS